MGAVPQPATLDAIGPEAALLAEISSPVERACAITAFGRPTGTLPPPLARIRELDLVHLCVKEGRKVIWVAKAVGISPSRVSRIVRRATTEGASA